MEDPEPASGTLETPLSRRRFLRGSLAVSGVAAGSAIAPKAGAAGLAPKVESSCATLTADGLVASVLTTAPASVRVEAWPTNAPSAKVESAWRATNGAGVARLTLPGAGGPGRPWSWRGVVRTSPGVPELRGRVHRVPARPAPGAPSAFTFAFGSCILQKHAIPALQVALSHHPVFFAMIGDLGYQDDVAFHPYAQTYDRYVELFRRILRRRDMSRLLEATLLFAVQDDHDYGQDDAYRQTVKTYAAQAFADVIPGARWPEPDYRRWSVGQVDFFLTDNRRYRDAPSPPFDNDAYRSVLGNQQRNWLLDGMASSNAKVKVVFIPMTMAWYWSEGEREAVLQAIADRVEGTVIFCAGDKHAGAFIRHADRVWELLASPLENPTKHKTPMKPGVLYTENGTDRALWNVVGVVDVDTASAQTVTLRLLRDTGDELHREIVALP
jgi:PhoD-like phosphatase